MNDQSPRHVIIAGSSRCATTSLFLYLADHPRVCAASMKETGFFLDDDYPRRGRYHYNDGPASYGAYFAGCASGAWRLEATPDYLYCQDAAARISAALPEARLIFILREPIDRLISWYHFARQLGWLPTGLSFSDYVNLQRGGSSVAPPGQHNYHRALQQGRYASYLQAYYNHFDRRQILVVGYSRVVSDPAALTADLCAFLDIAPFPIIDRALPRHNRSLPLRATGLNRQYVTRRDNLRGRYATNPTVMRLLRPLRRSLEPVWFRLSSGREQPVVVPDELRRELETYYAGEREAVGALTGQPDFAW